MPTVLLAHSDPDTRDSLAAELRTRGITVIPVPDVESALDEAAGETSSFLVEAALLESEELEVQTRLDLRAGRPVRILALTHTADTQARAIYKRHGAGLLARPVEDLDRLATMLRIQGSTDAPWEAPPRKASPRKSRKPAPATPASTKRQARPASSETEAPALRAMGWSSIPKLAVSADAPWEVGVSRPLPDGTESETEPETEPETESESASESETATSTARSPAMPPATVTEKSPKAVTPLRSPWAAEEEEQAQAEQTFADAEEEPTSLTATESDTRVSPAPADLSYFDPPVFSAADTRALPAGEETTLTDGDGPTLLVVDDDAVFRGFLSEALASQGYRVHTAINAPNALRFLKTTPGVQMVIADLNMPHIDGFELKHEIDEWLGLKMPYIVCTADTSDEKFQTAAKVGAAALVPKPIEDLDAFFAIVLDTLRDAGVVPKA